MRILCAPDKFKGTLTAQQAGEAMRRGIALVSSDIDVEVVPLADGGEGTLDVFHQACGGRLMSTQVHDAYLGPRVASWLLLEQTPAPAGDRSLTSGPCAVIEAARAIGLASVRERDPEAASSFGLGELILAALATGVTQMLVALGGSATNDAGAGALMALGARFWAREQAILTPLRARDLTTVEHIVWTELDARLATSALSVLCDVRHPLLGAQGATHTFAAQKGATPAARVRLEQGVAHLATLFERSGRACPPDVAGAGAAGGLGAGLFATRRARLVSGAAWVLEAVGFDARLTTTDLCLTGEGRLDASSFEGKVCGEVAARAARRGVPTLALVGQAGRLGSALPALFSYAAFAAQTATPALGAADELRQATARSVREFLSARR